MTWTWVCNCSKSPGWVDGSIFQSEPQGLLPGVSLLIFELHVLHISWKASTQEKLTTLRRDPLRTVRGARQKSRLAGALI